jgi:hypothetical protein
LASVIDVGLNGLRRNQSRAMRADAALRIDNTLSRYRVIKNRAFALTQAVPWKKINRRLENW